MQSYDDFGRKQPATTTPSTSPPTMSEVHITPKDGLASSPSNGAERDDEEVWSDEDEGDGDRKRKRQRTSRPISVSCERCKERKVSFSYPCSATASCSVLSHVCSLPMTCCGSCVPHAAEQSNKATVG